AEIIVLKQMMKKSGIVTVDLEPSLFHNAILYVTLEPCSHNGKTPPCASAVTAAEFNKVYIGMKDPFKKVNGRGIKYLKQHGVDVEICRPGSKLEADIHDLNQPFIKWAETGMPYVIMKSGMTLDGKIATSTKESRWITGEIARRDARLERSKCDAVLVGCGTVKSDNPELATCEKYKNKKFLRVIIDKKLSLNQDSKIFRDKNVFVACTDLALTANKKRFKNAGIEFRSFGKDDVSIKKLLRYLGTRGVQSVFVEGGSGVNGAFHDAAVKDRSLLDRVLFYIAPKLIGGRDSISVIGGTGIEKLSKAVNLKDFTVDRLGDDLRLEGVINFY
ncbi:MAG: bifunctional diaminohydroxyphosphoribosylaminopyrimidine deaminase/5-amino-6-(5-phosphoribosylamino)uracil reductase RibD, partial [Patescibacteria group bacterium]